MPKPARRARPSRAVAAPPLEALPPAAWAAITVLAAVLALLFVTFPIYDTDLWQHLLVGKVIWTQHTIPNTQLWVWPIHGEPDVLQSWLFRAVLYPFWAVGGESGIFAWRWLTTLAAFGLLWKAARAAGARGPWVLVALLWCVMLYRYRSQARPETLVAVLVGSQLWLLEKRRTEGVQPGRWDPAWGVVPIAMLWANVHISYYIGLLLTGFHLVAALLPSQRARPPQAPTILLWALLASVAASLVNPFGWQALAEPFRYFFIWRHEPIYHVIGELRSVDWAVFAPVLLPVWLALLVLLAIWRWWRRGFDLVEFLVLVVFIPQALSTQRFLGYLAVLVAPFMARNLDEACSALRPRFLEAAWARAGAVAALLLALGLPALANPALRPGLGFVWNEFPIAACDWMAAHDVRGRGFNAFGYGGYMLWRFWPDKGRLPFMDAHAAGTRVDRDRAAYVTTHPKVWEQLDGARKFDYVLMPKRQFPGQFLLDHLDADSTHWALVFVDDAAVIYLRRDGAMADLAARESYRLLPGGDATFRRLGARLSADSVLRAQVRVELLRMTAASAWTSGAHDVLAQLAEDDGRMDEAARETRLAERAAVARPAK